MPGAADQSPLVGRDDELAQLTALLTEARAGRGGALLLEGEPGTGKSALLTALPHDGLRVLEATGVESELDLPLAGLGELLLPLVALLPALPARDAGVLREALALDAGADDANGGAGDAKRGADDANGGAGDAKRGAGVAKGGATGEAPPVVLARAALALLEEAARREPLALLVDDVQWLDPASRGAVQFVARRAWRIGVGVIVVRSLRDGPQPAWPGVPLLPLRDLSRPDALTLARRQGVSAAVAEALVDAVGGNPLALVEAPAQLTADQREGLAVLPFPLPAGERLQRLAAARVAALPEPARDALLLAATSADGDAVALAAALRVADGAPAPAPVAPAPAPEAGGLDALAPAEDAGLLALSPRLVRFSHPSIRSAVYHAASPSRRRRAHLTLAAVTDEPRRAWHRAVAATAVDEPLAAELEALAVDARRRGAPATASTMFQRAAELTPDPVTATNRTLAAAAAATVAGDPERALRLLDPLLAAAAEPGRRADVQLLRGMAILQAGQPAEAYEMLEAEADAIEGSDPGRASMLLIQACVALVSRGSVARLVRLTDRTTALVPEAMKVIPQTLHAQALVALAEHREARALLLSQRAALEQIDPVGPLHDLLSVAALCHVWMEDHEEADARLTMLTRRAREHGAVDALALPLAVHSGLHRRRGNWDRAEACAAEAVAIADDGGVRGFAASFASAMYALLECQRGNAAATAAHAARVLEQGSALQVTTTLACAEQALGQLALGEGDAERAVVHLRRAREHARAIGWTDPSMLYTEADLAEALVRCGRPEEAAVVVDELAEDARRTEGAWAAAATARCRALLADDSQLDALLAESLAAHARVTLPFELARTQLAFGERLRRARRRSDARALLSAAHATFAELGAAPWETRSGAELVACGGKRRQQRAGSGRGAGAPGGASAGARGTAA
ncbi:ATP-binding protein, partial [Conexibacter sp. JD483]|uniref:ATP-binding protein n=3 Tax=Conexibacter TaxID=191494 RepID=UPI002870A19D